MFGVISRILEYFNIYGTPQTQFTDLPPDIQREILSLEPKMLNEIMMSSKAIYYTLQPILLDKVCNKPISRSEYRNYLRTKPEIFATFYYIDRFFAGFDTKLYKRSSDDNYSEWIDDIFNYSEMKDILGKSKRINNAKVTIDYILSRFSNDLDLKTQYQIYRKRLGCVNLDPFFAKKKVKQEFNELMIELNNEKIYVRSKMIAYIYLATHIEIFNIDFPVIDRLDFPNMVSKFDYNDEIKFQQLTRDIPILIDLINRAIDQLQ